MRIGDREIGPDRPCFVIAEAGVNHNGDVALARRLIDAAAAAGADAVKFQTYRTELVVAREAPKAAYQERATGADEGQFEMLKRLELPFAAFAELSGHARARGILFLSTPFDAESLAFLVSLGVPALKIASGEIDNVPLLRRAAASRLPLIVSSGMAALAEVEAALATLRGAGAREVALLHCVSAYPARAEDANLRAIPALAARLGVPVGFSDHTEGIAVALAARALGAAIVEKHFTLDRTLPGPDHAASLEPGRLAEMVRGLRAVESALGDGIKAPRAGEAELRLVARRSLHAARALAPGEAVDEAAVVALRPAGGIGPSEIDRVVGRRARRAIAVGERLSWADLE
ncbi:MAG: N-acetylneuraminate synthase [Proteobacteria bacterium]|nr:N-acetylneuraminate synthase [Pseudomonadota bacterium]